MLLSIILSLHLNNSPIIFGHRGARGFFPENTLEGFINAVKMGASALELDVVISKDSQVVVSHEPWFNPAICSRPDGKPVKRSGRKNMYRMNYSEIKKYDCGKRGHPDFPQQEKISACKPLLKDVIAEVEKYCSQNRLAPVTWLIEIKSSRINDNKFHPPPGKFAKLVYEIVKSFHIDERIILQSFDQRLLKELHKMDSALKLGLLAIRSAPVKRKIKQLGFIPYCYNPSHRFIKKKSVEKVHRFGIKIFTWTVNEEDEKQKLIARRVDGIVTDYPAGNPGKRP